MGCCCLAEKIMEIQIFRLPKERWREYKNLRLESLRTSAQFFNSSLRVAESQPDEFWQNCLENSLLGQQAIILAAQYQQRLIGTISLRLEEMGSSQECNATLSSLYVNSQFRGQGIASRLVEAIILVAKEQNVKNLLSSVQAENTSAIQLYQKWQFKQVGRFSKTFKHQGEYYDEVILQKILQP